MKFLSSMILVMGSLPSMGFSQAAEGTTPEPEKKSSAIAKLSLIAVGPIPPRRYRMPDKSDAEQMLKRLDEGAKSKQESAGGDKKQPTAQPSSNPSAGGIPIMLPPRPGEVPPGTVFFKAGKKKGPDGKEKEVLKPVPVSFNNPTTGVEVPAGVTIDLAKMVDGDEGQKSESFLKCPPLQPGGQYAMFLSPTGKGEHRWDGEPGVYMLRMDGGDFVPNQCMVLNFSTKPVRFLLGEAYSDVPARGGKTLKVEGTGKLVRCAAMASGSEVLLLNTAISSGAGTRSIYTFYDADPATNAGNPIGVFTVDLPETPTIPQPPAPKPS